MPRKNRDFCSSSKFVLSNTDRKAKITRRNQFYNKNSNIDFSEEEEEEEIPSLNADDDVSSYPESKSSAKPPIPSDQFSIEIPESSIQSNRPLYNQTSSSPYINIAPLPIFSGKNNQCPITHLSRFSKVCTANNVVSVQMMMKIFPVTLVEEALVWYDLNIDPYHSSLSWDEIKSSFLQAYQKIEYPNQFQAEIQRLKQEKDESVRSYFLRLQWVLNKWPEIGVSESLIRGVFWEKVKGIRNVKVRCGFCEGEEHEESECEIRKRMRELWRKIKEKKVVVCLPGNGDGVDKISDVGESMSGSGKEVKGESQCRCSKHQCGIKIERNNSLISKNSNAN
ncbi:Retrotransposon gag domain [Dillenia turbinata]|uniref:Retrotransposon gag domain n=1 Tax=Dillenia turbinata TaxID=194707 RepID=A0AAN8Z3V9_9MAGN